MSLDGVWALLIATWTGVTLCRVCGYTMGTLLPDRETTSEVLDALPACALAAIVGTQIMAMSIVGICAVGLGVVVFIWRGQLLVGFTAGLGILIGGPLIGL